MILKAKVIGLGARESTASPAGVQGIIHSLFRRVVNIRLANGRFLALARADIPPAPGTVIIDLASPGGWPDLGLLPGTPVTGDRRVIHLSPETSVVLAEAICYLPRIKEPIPVDPRGIPVRLGRAAQWGSAYFALTRQGRMAEGPWGFGPLVPRVLDLIRPHLAPGTPWPEPPTPTTVLDDSFAQAAYAAFAGLVAAICRKDPKALGHQARELWGLGPGLTPSGDDALAALMVALALTGQALGSGEYVLNVLNPAMIEELAGATTELSADFLRYAARGWGNAVLEEVVMLILAGDGHLPPETQEKRLAEAVFRLCGLGASSGIDQLCGLLLGVGLGLLLTSGHAGARPGGDHRG